MIIALAGRRIDPPNAVIHGFPAENVGMVGERLRALFKANKARVLVSSAACGADLLALEAAGLLGIRRRVVLPFERHIFRETSVVDQSAEWGPQYDQILDETESRGDLVVLGYTKGDPVAYRATNRAVLDQAMMIALEMNEKVTAVVAWNGLVHSEGDLTNAFRDEAESRGLPVLEIRTSRGGANE
ncbi:MAG: hypothetical protein LAP61_23280 [Acidobacteriia bacterium]|nr:hypothetical protein [Terriglobia bacterium]